MRIGLVLGAGGVLGGSWLAGALEGVLEELGWDPGGAERIVGTSAGSMVGALLASGVPPWYLAAHCAGEELGAVSAALSRAEASRGEGSPFRLRRGVTGLSPGSWRLALASLARPHRSTPAAALAGWLPRGLVSTEPLKHTIRAAAGHGWAPHPGFHAIACDYATGRRVALGAADGSLADAVAASCAIPGVYRPVAIAGRRFVDGAIHSPSNLDALAGCGLDLVICLNPMSSLDAPRARTVGERAAAAVREHVGRRLNHEARAVRESGTDTVLIHPTADDLDAMATQPTSRHGREQVIETAIASVRSHLRQSAVAARFAGLPRSIGPLVGRPAGDASTWPDLLALAEARWHSAREPALAVQRFTGSHAP